jgi:ubiquitin carboxyl-terminal hydrolase 5/13
VNLDPYRASGLQTDETLFAQGTSQLFCSYYLEQSTSNEPQFDQGALEQLMGMGFPEMRCKKALIKTGNNGPDVAMNWLFEHMEDPDIDDPIIPNSGVANPSYSMAELSPLMDMGFTQKQAERALRETVRYEILIIQGNNMERAVDWLFSHPDAGDDEPVAASSAPAPIDDRTANYQLFALISHKGTSSHCGHYVAYVRKGGRWALYNDSTVVEVPDITSAAQQAYIYVYQRL